MKVLVVGGVAGGASTVARLRRLDEKAEIIMFERGEDISYANCGIPYYLGGTIKERSNLTIISKEEFENIFAVSVRTRSEVISIDRERKVLSVQDLVNNNLYEESYDKLVLSPGGSPVRPPLPGINSSRIFTLRNLQDMDNIKSFLQSEKPKKAVIVGAGFIGLEVAENLASLGIKVSIVELANQVMNIMDYEMATVIHQHLHSHNIELYLKDGVQQFREMPRALDVVLKSGRSIEAQLVILAIGVRPEKKLAADCGLEIGSLGGIRVNSRMETTDPDIYALGDVIEVADSLSGRPALIPLANSANKQGRIVADNICGLNREYKGTPGTAIAKVFDLAVASTGANEKSLIKQGVVYDKVFHQPASHAGYYPDAYPMVFKLLYSPDSGKVLGAQLIGSDGVDKRIDVIASMIQNGHTVSHLAELELAYAPPFSSAKDPVNLAGMIAMNQMEGRHPVVFWDQVEALQKKETLFIDVRSKLEYDLGHIEGALNIPLEELRENLDKIPHDKKIVIYCNQGKKGYFALTALLNRGYTSVFNLSGGYKLYRFTTEKQENCGIFDENFIDKQDDLSFAAPGEGEVVTLDACGLQCPGPIMKLAQSVNDSREGNVVEVIATDPGFGRDVEAWCKSTGNQLLVCEKQGPKIMARIQKGRKIEAENFTGKLPNDKTIVVFSNDLDRALASFVIANGSASMGRQVTMFFTFWGLNVLRKRGKAKVKKGVIDKMFGLMMPKGSKALKLSKLHMGGMGTAMMKGVMKSKNISSLEEMIEAAVSQGVRLVACQMSMDMMGIKKEELIEAVEIGGVASYLNAAEFADTNLFI